MKEEVRLRKDVERGQQAERLLSDTLIKQAFELVENHIVGKFRDAPIRDTEGVIRAKELLHSLKLFRNVFEEAVRSGTVAKNALDPKKRGAPFLGDISWLRR